MLILQRRNRLPRYHANIILHPATAGLCDRLFGRLLLAAGLFYTVLGHAWLLGMAVLLLVLRWPQLTRPTTASFLFFSASQIVSRLIGVVIGGVQTGE